MRGFDVSAFISRLAHWQKALLACGLGLLAALAFVPFKIWPGLLAYGILQILIDCGASSARNRFFYGWCAGFGFFLISCWWVSEAFLVDADTYGWMAPFAVAILAGFMGLYWGVTTWIYGSVFRSGHPIWGRILGFAALFSLIEQVRGVLFTGFAWNPVGASWAAGSVFSQWAAFVGVYGLSLLTLILSGLIANGLFLPVNVRGPSPLCKLGVGLALFMGTVGLARIPGGNVVKTDDFMVRIVQANIKQEVKWRPGALEGIVRQYVTLTQLPPQTGKKIPDLVIWPEGALPASAGEIFYPNSNSAKKITQAIQPGQSLALGAYRGELGPQQQINYYNSLIFLHGMGAGLWPMGIYDKNHLVPFGEYLPFPEILTAIGFKDFTHIGDGFTPGARPEPMSLPGIPRFQPLICYEAMFPNLAAPDQGARWILNISNDAWYGLTYGPLQHHNLSAYRAIEMGLPMVRSTPTGFSSVVDPYGRIVTGKFLRQGEAGVIDAYVPRPLSQPPLAGRVVNLSLFLALFVLMVSAITAKLWRKKGDFSAKGESF